MKINSDKYYTPIEVANYCWDRVIEKIGSENISDIIEPSCGNGAFFHYNLKPDFGFDIEPEYEDNNIFKQDYLILDIPYKKNRLIIGNPPYGNRMNLAQKFFKKSVLIGDYIAFILPISQLNNTQSLYEFDLIYSEDLGEQIYTDRKLHCCFNIYKRPNNGELNKKVNNKLECLRIKRNDSKGYDDFSFDIRMCAWGDGTAGKILNDDEHYSAEYKLLFDDNLKEKSEVVNFLKTFNWKEYLNCIAMRKIQQFHIIDVIKKQFPNIK